MVSKNTFTDTSLHDQSGALNCSRPACLEGMLCAKNTRSSHAVPAPACGGLQSRSRCWPDQGLRHRIIMTVRGQLHLRAVLDWSSHMLDGSVIRAPHGAQGLGGPGQVTWEPDDKADPAHQRSRPTARAPAGAGNRHESLCFEG